VQRYKRDGRICGHGVCRGCEGFVSSEFLSFLRMR
jgi:hypothetical protein